MKQNLPQFTSRLTHHEMRSVMIYFVIHVAIMPWIINFMVARGTVTSTEGNFLYYVFGTAYMLATCMPFLRRDFDPLVERPFHSLMEILTGYFTMVCINFCVNLLLIEVLPTLENPNNTAVSQLVFENFGMMKASLMYFTPITEEMLFRAGIFGMIYQQLGRKPAYIVSVGLFSLYHVWSYAIVDPMNWIYLLQYIPVSFLLARCYERTNSIWCPIFFHMTVNSAAVSTLDMLQAVM